MDARERLRRYLEQRREMGEEELVLDGMTVEDVLRIVGAGGAAKRAPRETERPLPAAGAADWRETLRAAGATEESRKELPAKPTPGATPKPDATPAAKDPAIERAAAPTAATRGDPLKTPGAVAPDGLVVGAAAGELFRGATAELASLEAIADAVRGCQRCRLYKSAL